MKLSPQDVKKVPTVATFAVAALEYTCDRSYEEHNDGESIDVSVM